MRRLLKWGCLGTLGLVVLIVVIGAVAAVVAPPSPRQTPGEGGGGQPRQQEKPRDPGAPGDYLKVSGTPGIPFSCSVMDGNGQQRTVDGKTPARIKLKDMGFGAISSNVCQKTGSEGLLKVSLVVGGEVQKANQTKAQYGVVTVDY
jgi:hypothetical protein